MFFICLAFLPTHALACPCAAFIFTAEQYRMVRLCQGVLTQSTTTCELLPVFCQNKCLWADLLHVSRLYTGQRKCWEEGVCIFSATRQWLVFLRSSLPDVYLPEKWKRVFLATYHFQKLLSDIVRDYNSGTSAESGTYSIAVLTFIPVYQWDCLSHPRPLSLAPWGSCFVKCLFKYFVHLAFRYFVISSYWFLGFFSLFVCFVGVLYLFCILVILKLFYVSQLTVHSLDFDTAFHDSLF